MSTSTPAKGRGARELTVVDLSDIRSALLEVWVLVVLEETLDEALEDVKGDLPLPASLQLLVQDDGGVLWLELWLRAHGGDGLDRQDGGHNNGKLAKHVHLCGTRGICDEAVCCKAPVTLELCFMPEQSYLCLRLLGLVSRLPRSIRWYFYTYKIR